MNVAEPLIPVRYSFVARTSCPGCGVGNPETLYVSRFTDGAIGRFVREYYGIDPTCLDTSLYQLDRCQNCGLVFQANVGDDRLLSDLYTHWVEEPGDPDRDIPTYREDIGAIRLSRDAHEIMAAASFLGKPLRQLRTLDYGMGWALWPRIAAALGCHSHGSDLSEPRMAFAREHGVETVDDAAIAGITFDFINTEQVFEHVPEPLRLLRFLAASLVPGGVIKISVPSGEDADAIVSGLAGGTNGGGYAELIPVQPLEHVNSFSHRSLSAMASAARLEVVRPSYWHRYAFLRHRATLDPTRPRKVAKEMVRPWYQYHDSRNLFMWLQRPQQE